MNFAQTERDALRDPLLVVGPDSPQLFEGWTTADLAAHRWIREHDPIAAPGMVVAQLSGLTRRRMDAALENLEWAELIERIRSGPARFSLFAIPGLDEPSNAIEYFVHHEDVRRAGEHPASPRDLGEAFEDYCWKRLALLGRAFFRSAQTGVVCERRVRDEVSSDVRGEQLRMKAGSETTTIIGRASELVLFAHGRTAAADVELVGEPDSVSTLLGADLSV